jgi:hypothetical protein
MPDRARKAASEPAPGGFTGATQHDGLTTSRPRGAGVGGVATCSRYPPPGLTAIRACARWQRGGTVSSIAEGDAGALEPALGRPLATILTTPRFDVVSQL